MGTKSTTTYLSFNGYKNAVAGIPLATVLNENVKNYLSFGRTRAGIANPNRKSQIRANVNASTPFSAFESLVEAESLEGNFLLKPRSPLHPQFNYPESYKWKGHFNGLNLPTSLTIHHSQLASVVKADAIATRRLHQEIERAQHQFQGGVFVGQLGQALRMVLSPAKALRSSMASYFTTLKKRGSGVKPQKRRKVLSDTYLEYTFGWQPLLTDCKEAAIALARLSHNIEKSKFKVFGEDVIQVSQAAAAVLLTCYFPRFAYNKYTLLAGKAQVLYYGSCQGALLNSDGAYSKANALQQLCGFDLRSFAPTAWELIPWSFAVDYFTNIGDVISAYSHNTSIVKWISRVQILSSERMIRIVPDWPATWADLQSQGYSPASWERSAEANVARLKSTYRSVDRTLSIVPFPALSFEIPGFDSMKWINLAALALGARPKSPFY